MPPREETLEDLYREVGLRPAALNPRNTARRKMVTPLPPSMRGLPGYAASNVSRMAEEDIGRGRALGMEPGRGNQVREAAGMLAETTGLPGALRANQAFSEGDTARGLGEAGMGLLNLAGTASMFAPMRNVPRAPPPRAAPTRVYRGLNEPYNEDRAALLGNRWWHTNPEVASTYAPGTEGAHVIPGQIDESSLRLAHLQLTPGTMWRSIPLRELPADIRRQFPRATTHVRSEEVAEAARAAGYDGVTFQGMRDSGFAGAMQGNYPGFQTGDDGRVVAIFRDDAVQSPFPRAQPQAPTPPTPPPTLSPTWERAADGSVLPVRPQSDRLFSRTAPTSADLRGAAATPPVVNTRPSLGDLPAPRPRGNAPDPGGVFANASGRPPGSRGGGGGKPPPIFPSAADRFRTTDAPNAANVNRERTALDDELGLPDGPGEVTQTGWMPGLTEGAEKKFFIWAHDRAGTRGSNPIDGPFDSLDDAKRALTRMRASPRWGGYNLGVGRPTERALSAWGLNPRDGVGWDDTRGVPRPSNADKPGGVFANASGRPKGSPPILRAAIEHFGLTDNFREAGYMLPDGKLLDLSGRHEMLGGDYQRVGTRNIATGRDWAAGQRNTDHRDLPETLAPIRGDGGDATDRMWSFMTQSGSVRLMPGHGVSVTSRPTRQQIEAIVRHWNREYRGEPIYIDVDRNGPWDGSRPRNTYIERPTIENVTAFFDEVFAP